MPDLSMMTRAGLAAEYVRCIGYDPFADDPATTDDEVRQTLAEWRRIAAGEV